MPLTGANRLAEACTQTKAVHAEAEVEDSNLEPVS